MVGTPRAKLKEFERELLEGDWHQIRPEVEVQRVGIPNGGEGIRSRFSARIEKALTALEKR